MAGFKTIKDQIVATLQTLVPSTLAIVYGKEEKTLGQFPAVCVSGNAFQGSYLTVGIGGSNEEVYQHFIRLYFRTDETNDTDYEDVLESVADSVISALRHNVTLNGSCDWSLPISGTWSFDLKEVPVRCFEITESATKIVTR